MTNGAHPPIIVMGMHRSGTSMVASILEELGIFTGRKKDTNEEALFFRNLNEWLLRQSGGTWDNPEPIHYLLRNKAVRELTVDYMSHLMKTPRVVSLMGWKNYLRYRTPQNLNTPWGWKDPRNTYTLPVWLDLFPQARVINIYRHGVDVAASLKKREWSNFAEGTAKHERRKTLYWIHPKRYGFNCNLRTSFLEGGFSLWEDYLRETETHLHQLGKRAMSLRYEDSITDSLRTVESIAHFCGLRVNKTRLDEAASKVKKERPYKYRDSSELEEFAARMSARLARYGY